MHTVPPFDEKAVVLLIAEGDEQAFADLFDFYRNRMYTVAFSLTNSTQAAEEIVQDVFVKVWLKRTELPGIEKLDAWLYVIARNMVFSWLRTEVKKNRAVQATENLLFSGSPQEALDKLGEKELRQLLSRAVDLLPKQQKQVYLLNKEEGLKQQSIAEQLNIAPQTVKKHLQYALRSIRAYILSRADLDVLCLVVWLVS